MPTVALAATRGSRPRARPLQGSASSTRRRRRAPPSCHRRFGAVVTNPISGSPVCGRVDAREHQLQASAGSREQARGCSRSAPSRSAALRGRADHVLRRGGREADGVESSVLGPVCCVHATTVVSRSGRARARDVRVVVGRDLRPRRVCARSGRSHGQRRQRGGHGRDALHTPHLPLVASPSGTAQPIPTGGGGDDDRWWWWRRGRRRRRRRVGDGEGEVKAKAKAKAKARATAKARAKARARARAESPAAAQAEPWPAQDAARSTSLRPRPARLVLTETNAFGLALRASTRRPLRRTDAQRGPSRARGAGARPHAVAPELDERRARAVCRPAS